MQSLTYIQNPGNLGDALIALGVYSSFKIRSIVPAHKFKPQTNGCYLYSGGGNLTNYYSDCADVVTKFIASDAASLIILPHSVHDVDHILELLDQRVLILCRERQTYTYIKQVRASLSILLMPDMAFFISSRTIKYLPCTAFFSGVSLIYSPRVLSRLLSLGFKLAVRRLRTISSSHLVVRRADCESAHMLSNSDNDISGLYGSFFSSRAEVYVASCFLLLFVNSFNYVDSDRLHIAIASCLLGKKTILRDNSYGKNKAIYDYSMSHLANVVLVCNQ